jgi:hypothetical protein
MNNYNKVKTEGVEAIEKRIFARHAEENGEFMYISLSMEKEELMSTLSTYAEKVHKATLEDVYEKLDKNYLGYCREHNGLPYCKNCGLDLEELRNLMK